MTDKPNKVPAEVAAPPSGEWFQEWFDSPYYHLLYQHRDEQEAELFLDRLLEELHPAPGARILDLACGKGRHARHLASRGFEVTGIDLSANSIRYARQFEGQNLSFFRHDMRLPFRDQYFDLIVNFFTSFGYFNSERDDCKVLENVAAGLRPRGIFVLDFFNSLMVIKGLAGKETKTIEGVTFYLEKLLTGGRVIKNIRIDDQGKTASFRESVRLFVYDDFVRLFTQCGLRITKVFGDYHLRPFEAEHSTRLILLAEKND